jgi:hypothetical protein
MTYIPQISGEIGAFGELITAHTAPIIQISNKYKIDPNNLEGIEVFSATGGSGDNDGNQFRVQSGTSVGGYGVVRSKETINYHAGQGIEGKITASFTTGIANSLQFAGMFSVTETVAFGYDGADFSCLFSYGGVAELQNIQVTATGAGTCTVTLDGDSVGITVTNSDVQTNAEEIRAGLAGDATLSSKWRFEQVDDTVYCIAKAVGDKTGSFSVSGGVTANITEAAAGVAKTDAHVAQSSWNIKTSPFSGFDPTKINVYKIQFGFLGAANILFSIYNPETRRFVDVHQIKWANTSTSTHIGMPNLKMGWTAASLGSSGTNLTVKGASTEAAIEGDEIKRNDTHAEDNTKSGVGSANFTNILTLKNRVVFSDQYNLDKIEVLRMSVENEGNKGLIVELIKNATIAGTQNYQFHDEFNSGVVYDTAGTTVTGGELIDAFTVGPNANSIIDLTVLKSELLPEDTLTLAAKTTSTTSIVTGTATWKENK